MTTMQDDPHPGASGPTGPTEDQDGGGPTPRSNQTRRTSRQPECRRTHTQEKVDPQDPQKTRMEEDPHLGATRPEGPMVREACRLG